jgi:MFS family permease
MAVNLAARATPIKRSIIRTFSSLRHRNFRLLWIGSIATQVGYWMFNLAQGWLAFQLTNSEFWLGLVGFVSGVPMLVFSLVGGELADRYNRRNLMLIYQLCSMVFITVFAALVTLRVVTIEHVIVISFLFGSMMSLNIPLRQALLPDLVERDDLTNAVALQSVGWNAMRVVGPALAGVLIAYVGMEGIFWLMVAGYLWTLVMVFQMDIPTKTSMMQLRHPLHNMLDGFHYIWKRKDILILMLSLSVPTLFAMPYLQLLPVFARDILQVGAGGLGVLSSAVGVGALVTALVVASMGNTKRKGWWLIGASALFGLTVAAFGLSQSYVLSIVLLAATGICFSVMQAFNSVLIQTLTPDEYRGRVFSVYALTWGLQPLGNLVIGWLAETTKAPLAVFIGGMVSTLAMLVLAWRSRQLREMD